MAQKGNVAVNFFKSIYHNEFQWLANRNWIRSFQILYFPHHFVFLQVCRKKFRAFLSRSAYRQGVCGSGDNASYSTLN